MKNTKRIISVITALILVIYMFAVMPTALADNTVDPYTVTHRYEGEKVPVMIDNATYEGYSNNLLGAEQLPVAYFPAVDESSERTLVDFSSMRGNNSNEFKKLTDRQIANTTNDACWAQLSKSGSGTARNVVSIDLEYDLGSVCEVQRFVLASVQDVSSGATNITYHAKYYVGQYEVYLADSKEDLYNAENLIYSFDQPDDYSELRSGLQDVTFNVTKTGRYLAVRIIDSISYRTTDVAEATGVWPHIAEIGVFGEAEYSVETYTDSSFSFIGDSTASAAEKFAALGDDLLYGKIATPYVPNDTLTGHTLIEYNQLNGNNNNEILKMLTDDYAYYSGSGSDVNYWAKIYYAKTGDARALPKVDLEYDLGGIYSISNFALISMFIEPTNTYYPKFFIGEYEVYVSDSKSDLYDKENLVYSYNYTKEDDGRSGVQVVSFKNEPVGQYVAVRILNPISLTGDETSLSASNIYPRISQISVYGEEVETAEPGDANESGEVDIRDLVRVQQYLVDNTTEINVVAADLDASGKIETADLAKLREMLLG